MKGKNNHINGKTLLWKRMALLLGICLFASGCGTGETDSLRSSEPNTEESTDSNAENAAGDSTAEYIEETDISADGASESAAESELTETDSYDVTFAFTGDVNLDDTWSVMTFAAQQPNGVFDCIDGELVDIMRAADICCINNEFTFSAEGEPLDGKLYTFRSDPSNVGLLLEMGVDLVTLANNHVYDYGRVSFESTLSTLSEAGIDYVGAGMNLEEAMQPVYYEWDGLTVAVVNATRAEKYIMTPEATENEPGVLRCYDTTYFEQVIAEADANADFVICCVHWGTEDSYVLEDVQTETARLYIDCGADIIIGTHTHCLQAIEYYKGKPIFYSLGNFWFNEERICTGILELHLTGDAKSDVNLACTFYPAIQEDCVTRYASSEEDRSEVFGLLNEISINAVVDEDGIVQED